MSNSKHNTMQRHTIDVKVGEHTISFETGKMAKQANGAVLVRQGETIVFATACASPEATPGGDFLPLRVDYQEKFSSAGKTLGGFIKREGRPAEREILVSRLIDRPLRPMFPEGYYNEVQLLAYVLSYDGSNQPEPLAICAASAALVLSDIPLLKPVAAVRVGLVGGQFVINPTLKQMKESKLDLLLAGTHDAILMIEGYCDFLTEQQVLEAIEMGAKAITTICDALKAWRDKKVDGKALGKVKTGHEKLQLVPKETTEAVEKLVANPLKEALAVADKQHRETAIDAIKKKMKEELIVEGEINPKHKPSDISAAYKATSSRYMREMILEKGVRSDGRGLKDIRPIDIEQGILPRAHGSSLFTRGETQALAVCTLGSKNMEQRFEDLNGDSSRAFYLQYTFPPSCVGEVGRVGAPGRREVGHGKLAERALQATIPSVEKFPYTIRLESNILESNGSSSMASVCGGCLALMDAGVPIKHPIAGIAMGLLLDKDNDRFAILSDILGIEDALGDMDFKVTGSSAGITAFQMDIKVEGITFEIMKKALEQAHGGRMHILKKMTEACSGHREEMSPYAPRIEQLKIMKSKIGKLIGPGGKTIKGIIEETGAEINVDDSATGDYGVVSITSSNPESMKRAKAMVDGLTAEVEIGKIYEGRVSSVVAFGVFVEILPGTDGLCHISELDTVRVDNINDCFKAGDKIKVIVLDIDVQGRIKLSRKALLTSGAEKA